MRLGVWLVGVVSTGETRLVEWHQQVRLGVWLVGVASTGETRCLVSRSGINR